MAQAAHPLPGPTIKHILFATDYSPASEKALIFARAIAHLYGASVCFLHVLPPEPGFLDAGVNFREEAYERERHAAERQMASLIAEAGLSAIQHELLVERGDTTKIFRATVAQHDIDLVVLGTRGRSGLEKLVLGSVAETVFRTVPCPVLTIGPQVSCDPSADMKLNNILCAIDLSERSVAPLTYAVSFANVCRAKLTITHVLPYLQVPLDLDEDVRSATLKRMKALLPAGVLPWCEPQYIVAAGSIVPSILEAAEKTRSDVLIIGTHHSRTPEIVAHVPWAIAHKVVVLAHCPVLSVRT